MSFTRTEGCINNLSGRTIVTLDQLLNMLVCAAQDVLEHNKVDDIENVSVGDGKSLVRNHIILTKMLLDVFDNHKEDISEVSSTMKERYNNYTNEAKQAEAEIEAVDRNIALAEEKKQQLDKKNNELFASRGYLLGVEKECEELKRKIDILSDTALDEKEKEKNKLTKEFGEREGRANELEAACNQVRRELADIEGRIKAIKEQTISLDNEKKKLEEEEEACLKEKNGLESGNENIKKKIEEYKKAIDEFPELNRKTSLEYQELKANIAILINAFNSAMSDSFMMDALYRIPNTPEKLTAESYPDYNVVSGEIESIDELGSWFERMNERVTGLMKVYENMLCALVSQTEKITQEVKEK